jgi:hypothetical protein
MSIPQSNYLEVGQIDGGGIMLYIAFPSLLMLEQNVPGKRLCNFWNLIYGESTGAIAGVCFAAGASVREVWDLYDEHGKHIFTPQHSYWNIFKKLGNPKYDRQRVLGPLSALLQKYGVTHMGDLRTRFVAGTVNAQTKKNVFQKSWKLDYANSGATPCVNKSFAAPYAFGPVIDYALQTVFMDGGMGNMNCTLRRSYDEATVMLAEGDYPTKTGIRIFSFGTGYSDNSITFEEAKSMSLLKQVYEVAFDKGLGLARSQAVAEQVDTMQWLQRKLGSDVIDVRRFDTLVPAKMNRLDAVEYKDEFVRLGWEIALDNKSMFDILPTTASQESTSNAEGS